ncbi:MAG: hypothetical protein JNK76_08545 [Planctomycetales bacterium]|nr:hypothetical protein [Planctomycetales bacterium]
MPIRPARIPPGFSTSAPEPEATEDYAVFGWVRGVRERSLMLELRLKDGSVTSFGYAWLKKAGAAEISAGPSALVIESIEIR